MIIISRLSGFKCSEKKKKTFLAGIYDIYGGYRAGEVTILVTDRKRRCSERFST